MGSMFNSLFGSIRTFAVLLAAGILGIVALGLLLRALFGQRQAAASKNWPSVNGVILTSEVAASRRRGRNGVSYYPFVMYEYTVNGQRYKGNRLRFGAEMGYGFPGMVQRTLDKYPPGGTATIYYNPDNPNEAVLEQSTNIAANFLIVGILLVVIVVLLTSFGVLRIG
jgi:hypothetical protein